MLIHVHHSNKKHTLIHFIRYMVPEQMMVNFKTDTLLMSSAVLNGLGQVKS